MSPKLLKTMRGAVVMGNGSTLARSLFAEFDVFKFLMFEEFDVFKLLMLEEFDVFKLLMLEEFDAFKLFVLIFCASTPLNI